MLLHASILFWCWPKVKRGGENNVIVIKAKNGLGAEGLVAAAAALEKLAHTFPNVTVRLELEGWNEESSNKGDDRNNQGQCADDA